MSGFMEYFLTNHLGVDLMIITSLTTNIIKAYNSKDFKDKLKQNPVYELSVLIFALVLIMLYILIDFYQVTYLDSAVMYYFIFSIIIIGAKILSIRNNEDNT